MAFAVVVSPGQSTVIVLNSLAEPAFLCISRQPTCALKISYGKINAPTQQQLIRAARSSDVCNSIRLQHGAGKLAKKNNNTFPARVFFQDAQDSVERNDLCPEPEQMQGKIYDTSITDSEAIRCPWR